MKRIILNIIILMSLGIFLTGCYTVVWSPEDNFPTESDYYQSNYDSYYNNPYYGEYGYYYNYPWWLTLTPPAANSASDGRDNATAGAVRNNDGGRGTAPRDNGDINNAPPPARNTDSGSSSSSNVGKSSTSSGSSSTTTRSSSGSDSNNVRNNNGGRNSGGRK